jgi:hypothetical protein
LLDDDFGFDQPAAGGGLFLFVDHAADDLSAEAMDELLFGEFFHFGDVELLVVASSDAVEVGEVVVL